MAHSITTHHERPEADAPAIAPARPLAISLLVSLRPAQWTKNLIVFAALLFGQRGNAPAFLDPHADRTRAGGVRRSSARSPASST